MYAFSAIAQKRPRKTEQFRCPPEQKIRGTGLMMPCDCLTADQL
jgi:hypothetical protein